MATFSKRHYLKLAQAIKEAYGDLAASSDDRVDDRLAVTTAVGYVSTLIANMLQDDNPNFDRDKFLKASGN